MRGVRWQKWREIGEEGNEVPELQDIHRYLIQSLLKYTDLTEGQEGGVNTGPMEITTVLLLPSLCPQLQVSRLLRSLFNSIAITNRSGTSRWRTCRKHPLSGVPFQMPSPSPRFYSSRIVLTVTFQKAATLNLGNFVKNILVGSLYVQYLNIRFFYSFQ